MCIGAICGDNHTNRPWWPTDERMDIPACALVVTDCCYRQLPAEETMCRLRAQEVPVGGYGDYQEIEPWPSDVYWRGEVVGTEHKRINWFTYASYYDPSWQIECLPDGDRSCKAHPRFLRGLHLREWRYEAA